MPVNQNKINEALSSVLVTDMDDVDAGRVHDTEFARQLAENEQLDRESDVHPEAIRENIKDSIRLEVSRRAIRLLNPQYADETQEIKDATSRAFGIHNIEVSLKKG